MPLPRGRSRRAERVGSAGCGQKQTGQGATGNLGTIYENGEFYLAVAEYL
jgi:hypothetical protein